MSPSQTVESTTSSATGFDDAVTAFSDALDHYVKGDPGPVLAVLSRREDVTLCNPVGAPRRGPMDVDQAAAEGATHLSGGSVRGFEEISRYATADLGYVVRIERTQARVDGSAEVMPLALRVTLIFRREGDGWKLAHRHADPITSPRPIQTTIEQPT
jgi:ketosteroid isomerase-like protein